MTSVSATAGESRPARRSYVSATMLRLLEVAGVLAAFYAAFTAVEMLEDRESTSHALIRIALASLLLLVSTWRVRDGAEAYADPTDPATINGQALRAPRSALREFAASWQAMLFMALMVGALVLAVFLRFYKITSEPYGIWFDEAQNGIVANQIIDGERPLFIGGLTQLPALFFYVFAAGIVIIGDSVTALRSVTGIAGIATVIGVYFLGRELFDHRTGVIAAFFMAVMRWHVNFSRFGMHGVFAPLFLVLTFLFVARGLHGKGTWNFALAGIMAGIGLQGYYGFLLAPFIGVLYLLHYIIFERKLGWLSLGKGMLILAACAMLVYAPLGIWAFRHSDEFNQRQTTVTITKDRTTSEVIDVAWDSTKKHLFMFNQAGDRNGRHNIPGAPMLDTAMGFLFVLGAGYAITRLNRSSYFLMLAWIAVCLQSGIWSVDFEAPQAYRTIGVTPAIALLAALPLSLLWRAAMDKRASDDNAEGNGGRPRIVAIALGVLAVAVTVVSLGWTARVNEERYFDVQLKRFDAWTAYDTDATYVAKEIQSLGLRDHKFYVAGVVIRRPVSLFLNPDHDDAGTVAPFDWTVTLPSPAQTSTVYLFDLTKEPFYEYLQRLYPDAEFETFRAPLNDPRPVAFEVRVSEEQVKALQGVVGRYTAPDGTVTEDRQPSMTLDWTGKPASELPLDATWTSWVRIPVYGEHKMTLLVPGSARMILDGEVIAEGTDTIEVTRTFYKGDHELRIEARIERPGSIDMLLNDGRLDAGNFFDYPQAGHGLLASFYKDTEFEGEPLLQQLDPFVAFRYHSELSGVAIPFSAKWQGTLTIPQGGAYGFEVDGNDVVSMSIDGESLSFTPGESTEVALAEGPHEIEVRLENTRGYAGAFVYWWPPGATEREVLPPEQLTPPRTTTDAPAP